MSATMTATDVPPEATEEQASSDHGRDANITQIVGFQLANEEYGLDIMKVQEIILIGAITQVPQVPEFVRGLINLRGHVIPIVDLRRRFGLSDAEQSEEQRIIVVNVRNKTIGIVVDAVNQVTRVTADQIEPPPTSVNGIDHEFITGLAKFDDRLVILLDIERLLTNAEKETLEGLSKNTEASAPA